MSTEMISMYFKVFGKVAGRIDPHNLGVSFSSMEGILRTIHDETKIEWKEIFDGFVVSGTFEQLKTVSVLLSCHLQKTKENKSERTPKDSRRPLVRHISTTRQSMMGSKVSTQATSLRRSATYLKTIDRATGGNYNNPSIQNECQVEWNESHGNPRGLVENEGVRVSERAKKLDQPDTTSDVSNTRKNTKMQIQDETESQSDGISRPTPVPLFAKKQFVFLENSKEKTSRIGGLKTGVVDNASPPSWVSEIGNTKGNGKRPEHQGENQDQGDVKNLFISVKKHETPHENSEGKTDRPTRPKRKQPAGLLDKDVSCENVQSQSTLFNRRCDADKTTLIVPVLNDASDQENQPRSHLETPKSDESLSKGKDEYTMEGNSSMYITSTGITVLLQKGDITRSDVDVLLSPANPTFPLPYDTTFLTSNGNLPCKGVLHAVLPPWIRDNENEKAYKLQIHRSLINALTLASGYRHRSVAIPPLGQDGNCIPLEVSAEVITRVIAKFSNNVGPMHTGINDIRIVCEDDDTVNVFEKELSSFSFPGDKTYFTMVPSKNVVEGEDKIAKYQRAGRSHAKCEEGDDSSIANQKSVEQIQESTSSPETGSLPNKKNAQIHANYPKVEPSPSSELKPHKPGSPAILPVVNGKKENVSSNSLRQCCENTITVFSSSCTKSTNISEANVFEILEVTETATVALVEEVAKRVTAHDDSSRKLVKESNFEVDEENLKERNANVAETSELLEKRSAPKMTKALTLEIQQPNLSHFSTEKEQSKDLPGSESRNTQRSLNNTPILHPFQSRAQETTEVHSLNSSSSRMDDALFVTSPTVEALLNADLRLGIQGLHIEHERNRNIDNAEDEANKRFLTFQQKESSSNEHFVSSITTSNEKQMITEKYFQEDINENLQSKLTPEVAEKGHRTKSTYDQKCDSKETDGKKDEIESALVDNLPDGNKGKGNDDHGTTTQNTIL